MDTIDEGRIFKVTVTQGDRWRAQLQNGGEVASADSLYELRRQVVSTAASLLSVLPEDRVVIEWTYPRDDGDPHVERQEVSSATAVSSETSARVGWHQRRVDEYLDQLRERRKRPVQ